MAMVEQKKGGKKRKETEFIGQNENCDDGKTWCEKYGQSREEKKAAYVKRSVY